jgi:hypothetical protein
MANGADPNELENKAAGTQAEEYVADQVGGERTPNEWYDVLGPYGEVIEVKSTSEEYASGRRGRFRLWRSQHDRLIQEQGTYWFLVDGLPTVRMDAREVSELLDRESLEWTGSGSHEMESQQVKIPWNYVIDPD